MEVDRAYRDGVNILILSDRGIDENRGDSFLLAVSALGHYLVRTKKRTAVAVILESAEPREVHHFATLLGYGACAISPYLKLRNPSKGQSICICLTRIIMQLSVITIQRFFTALSRLLPKWVFQRSQSYQGSQIFEAIGISKEVIDTYFTNTVSRIGITLKDIERDMNTWHMRAFDPLGVGCGSVSGQHRWS